MEKKYDVQDIEVDNLGNVYVLGKVFKSIKKVEMDESTNYSFSVATYSNKGESEDNYLVTPENKFLKNMKIVVMEKHRVVCAGFYTEEKPISGGQNYSGLRFKTIKGSYYLKIDTKDK